MSSILFILAKEGGEHGSWQHLSREDSDQFRLNCRGVRAAGAANNFQGGDYQILIPELLEANGLLNEYQDTEIPFHLLSERFETAHCQVS